MGAQSLIGLVGAGLVIANEWTSSDHGALGGVLWNQNANTADAHKALVRLGGELLFVLVLVLLAGIGGSWTTLIGVAIAGLWILFLINRTSSTKTTSSTGGFSLV